MNVGSRHKCWTAALITVVMLTAACQADDAVDDAGDEEMPSASVATVLTESGFAAVFGQLQANGVELAIEDLRNEGIADLTLVAREDAGDSNTTALNGLRRALREQPDVLVGPIVGTMVLAMRPEVERAEAPMIVTAATRSITQEGNRWIFRNFPHDGITKLAVGRFAIEELGIERPAILADSTAFGQIAADILVEFFDGHGIETVAVESVNPDDQDVSGQLSRIRNANADALFVQVLTGTPAAVALKGIRGTGLDVPIFMPPGVTSPSTLELVTDDEVEGVYAEAVNPLDPTDSEIGAYIERYQEKFESEPDIFATLMYDSVRMVGQAVAEGASGPEEIWRMLSTMEYQGLTTTFRADEEGNFVHEIAVIQFQDDKSTEVENLYQIEFDPRHV